VGSYPGKLSLKDSSWFPARKGDALVDALSQVRADFLFWYYPDRIAELRASIQRSSWVPRLS